MKKTMVVTLNFRFMRIPLLLCTFFLTVIICSFFSLRVPSLFLGKNTAESLILSTSALKNREEHAAVFSMIKKQAEKTPPKKEINQSISLQPEKSFSENISIKLPVPSKEPGEVKISNLTDRTLNINEYLSSAPDFLKEDFSVLIVHTHTTESYTPSESYSYTPTDTDRTRDKNYNMVRVGKEIKLILEKSGIKVYHDTTVNDYPSYNGSYNKSSAAVSNFLKNDSSIKIVLDVHRDAIEGANGEKIKYTCNIEGEEAACVMLVVGSSFSGLEHKNWQTNMAFAAQLQQYTQSVYPNLCRPINFRNQRFNQQLAPGAVIVEIGTNGNTLDEALLGAKYFSMALAGFLKSHS